MNSFSPSKCLPTNTEENKLEMFTLKWKEFCCQSVRAAAYIQIRRPKKVCKLGAPLEYLTKLKNKVPKRIFCEDRLWKWCRLQTSLALEGPGHHYLRLAVQRQQELVLTDMLCVSHYKVLVPLTSTQNKLLSM